MGTSWTGAADSRNTMNECLRTAAKNRYLKKVNQESTDQDRSFGLHRNEIRQASLAPPLQEF